MTCAAAAARRDCRHSRACWSWPGPNPVPMVKPHASEVNRGSKETAMLKSLSLFLGLGRILWALSPTLQSLGPCPFARPDDVIRVNFRRFSGARTREMARFSQQFALASAVATPGVRRPPPWRSKRTTWRVAGSTALDALLPRPRPISAPGRRSPLARQRARAIPSCAKTGSDILESVTAVTASNLQLCVLIRRCFVLMHELCEHSTLSVAKDRKSQNY